MSGYHILGGALDDTLGVVPPYQVVQQQNAGLPPGSIPPWYAMQYPAGFVPPLLVSVDNPLEGDPFDNFDLLRHHDERERRDLMRSHLLGAYDVAQAQVQMNALKRVPVAVARVLVRRGQDVVAETKKLAAGGWFQKALPVAARLDNVAGHLDWHQRELAKLADPAAFYASGDDLKKWCVTAFVESNAVEEGRAVQEKIWTDMRSEVDQALANLPLEVVQAALRASTAVLRAAATLPGKVFWEAAERTTGVPKWAWGVGIAATLGLLGYGAYKILVAAAPVATQVAVRRYL